MNLMLVIRVQAVELSIDRSQSFPTCGIAPTM